MAELIAAGYIAVAGADERIIGVVQIQRLDTGKGELGMLVADPAHRGQGVGRELVRFAERWSREQGSDTCSSRSWCRGSGLIGARSS